MNLKDITLKLYEQDSECTIYAKRPWLADSEAIICMEPDSQLVPDELKMQGYEYFLEVFIAQEVVPDLPKTELESDLDKWCGILINYAENDA